MEGEIGRFRRTHLVPLPKITTLAELAELVAAGDVADDDRVITGRTTTVGAAFAAEQPTLMPLPAERVRPAGAGVATGRSAGPGVDPAVPLLGARPLRRPTLERPAAAPPRSRSSTPARSSRPTPARSAATSQVLTLDHYLEVLARKPGALPGATVLAQAKAAGIVHRDRIRPTGTQPGPRVATPRAPGR